MVDIGKSQVACNSMNVGRCVLYIFRFFLVFIFLICCVDILQNCIYIIRLFLNCILSCLSAYFYQ